MRSRYIIAYKRVLIFIYFARKLVDITGKNSQICVTLFHRMKQSCHKFHAFHAFGPLGDNFTHSIQFAIVCVCKLLKLMISLVNMNEIICDTLFLTLICRI